MSNNYPSRSADKFMVRLPDGMRERLAASAQANRRSMNAELVVHLERALCNGELLRERQELVAAVNLEQRNHVDPACQPA
jgi:plasmid stability protein